MKQYIYLGVLLALIATHAWAYFAGRNAVARREQIAAATFKARESVLMQQLQDAQAKREVVYRDRIHTVEVAPDPSGCLDAPVPDSLGLRDDGR